MASDQAAFFFDVVVLGERRNSGAAQLPVLFENNFCASLVLFHLSVDLDHPALQLPRIAHAFQVTGKTTMAIWAQAKVVAEVEKMNSSRALLHPHDFARDAFSLARMFVAFLKWKTIGPGEAGQQ